MADTTPGQMDSDLAALTDQCVMCGLCLPHCPTYRLDQHEVESPRGRIALARRLSAGQLEPSETVIAHLDHCLGCLSCEAVCPSNVQYEQILVRTRAVLKPLRPAQGRWRRWLANPRLLVRLARISSAVRAARWLPGLARLLPKQSLFQRLIQELPEAPRSPPTLVSRPSSLATRGRIALFPGCVASIFDRDTLASGKYLLAALGYEVVVPSQFVCCGALALHAGESEQAQGNARNTREVLQACDAPTVLVSASGCLGSLRDHGLRDSGLKVDDILGFLAADPQFRNLRFRPLRQRVALHLPCTQMNVGSGSAPVRELLARIPALELLQLPVQPRCCGAAGNYFIEQPERADRLRSEKLDHVASQSPDLLLTTNIGCRIFLGNGLRQRDSLIPTLHPLTLLARQLETS
ncbi:MAG TPA: (Fe-S)-binding protein [Dokdonella sp.]|uniref:(Fe-S)-binding protein n=1 Tax=Dokdonella sp. TaxID=2291710 RepID=UPI002D811521|nr:(Fe-S)-binding protein [Dokdonella sp.]HET9033118.1 (Fe-S)-binding protein [Dokdonella sp.]